MLGLPAKKYKKGDRLVFRGSDTVYVATDYFVWDRERGAWCVECVVEGTGQRTFVYEAQVLREGEREGFDWGPNAN